MARHERRGQGSVASAEIRNGGSKALDVDTIPKVESFAMQVKRQDDDKEKFIEEMSDLLDSPFYSLNHGVPAFRQQLVSTDPRHWVVHWFFPNAEGGAIYVDYPRNKHEMDVCLKKAIIMEKLKLTYKLFRPEESRKLRNAMESMDQRSSHNDHDEMGTQEAVF